MNDQSLLAKILITGKPGVGKSTCVYRVMGEIRNIPIVEFVTDEIRENNHRVGFALQVLGGPRLLLAHKNLMGVPQIGAYGVNLKNLQTALRLIRDQEQQLQKQFRLYCIDEIGKMEALSPAFREWVEAVFNSPWPVVATIAARGTPWIESFKRNTKASIFTLTPENRDSKCKEVLAAIRQWGLSES